MSVKNETLMDIPVFRQIKESNLKKGRKQGLQKGRQEGRQEKSIEIAARLQGKGYSLAQIADALGVSVAETQSLLDLGKTTE